MSDDADNKEDPGHEHPPSTPGDQDPAAAGAQDRTLDGWELDPTPRLERTLTPEDVEKLLGAGAMDRTLTPEDLDELVRSGELGDDVTPEEVARLISSSQLEADESERTFALDDSAGGGRPPVPAAGQTAGRADLDGETAQPGPDTAANQWDLTLAAAGEDLDPEMSYAAPTIPLQRLADSITLDLRPGSVSLKDMTGGLGEYVDAKPLARGGMGVIYSASQARLRRGVAIKVMLEQRGPVKKREDAERQFIAEALVTGKLEHPNIVPVHDLGRTAEGQLYLSMKLVQGETLEDLLKREPAITPERISRHVDILIDICDGLDFAHTQGVVHQDIKPANIMIGQFGEVQIMDWGLAFEVDPEGLSIGQEDAMPSGTPAYLAPEQARGDGPAWGTHTDVFLLGALLYYALTDTPPHKGKSVRDYILAAMDGVRQTPSQRCPDRIIPADLEDLCMQAMEVDPADRTPSAAAFRDALRAHREHREATKLLDKTEGILAHRGKGEEEAEQAAELGRASMLCAQARELWPESDRLGHLEAEVVQAQARNALALKRPGRVLELLQEQPDSKEVSAMLAAARRMQFLQRRQKLHSRIRTVASVIVVVALVGVGYWAARPRPDGRYQADAALARGKADTEHPVFEKAEIALERAHLAFDQQRWDDSYVLFTEAKDKYLQCLPWDDKHRLRAADARDRVKDTDQHPRILELAGAALADAETERRKGHYEDAYASYAQAKKLFETDMQLHVEVDRLADQAVEHPLRAQAEAHRQEAVRLLERSGPDGENFAAAHESFQKAADLFARCLPWEEHHASEVAEAKGKADASRQAEYARAEALEAEAESLRQQGDYVAAYAKLRSALNVYRDIETNYDSTSEDAATAMRKIADPGASEAYAAAEDLLTQARAAKTRKDNKRAYALFESARQKFRETKPLDEAARELALAEKGGADQRLPDYGEGARLLALAEQQVAELDYERAVRTYTEARVAFYRARAYDPAPEERARAAKAIASERVKKSWREAEEALAGAEAALGELRFQDAQVAFKTAEKLYGLCRFDQAEQDQARALMVQAEGGSNTSLFEIAEAKYEEAFDQITTDGPAATEGFTAAIAAFESCIAFQEQPTLEVAVVPLEPPEVEQAVVAAKNRRDSASDLKSSRDELKDSNRMHRKSETSYRSAGVAFETAMTKLEQALAQRKTARREGDKSLFPQVIQLAQAAAGDFDKAIEDYSRVITKGR